MPIAPAIIAAIISATAAVGTGLYAHFSQPGTPSPQKVLEEQTPGAVSQATQARQAEVGQATQELPGLQAATSGGVNPGYLEQFGAISSGNGNLIGSPQLTSAVNNFLGLPGTGTQPISSGGATGGATGSDPAALIRAIVSGQDTSGGGGGGSSPAISGVASGFLNGTKLANDNPFQAYGLAA